MSLNNRTVLFACMESSPADASGIEGIDVGGAARMIRRIDEIEAGVAGARFNCCARTTR